MSDLVVARNDYMSKHGSEVMVYKVTYRSKCDVEAMTMWGPVVRLEERKERRSAQEFAHALGLKKMSGFEMHDRGFESGKYFHLRIDNAPG
jgi:hypothetical protein